MKIEVLKLARQQLDRKLKPFQPLRPQAAPAGGWIRAIRKSLGLTAVALAGRLGVTPPSVADLERSEASGSITLNTLRKAAAAMDCDVLYAIVPRTSLEDILIRRADEKARAMLNRVGHSMELEAQPVDPAQSHQRVQDLVQVLLANPKALWK